MPWLCTPLAYTPGFSLRDRRLSFGRLGQAQGSQAVHVFDRGRASLDFLFHRECNLGFSPLNTRRGAFFWLALYWFGLLCFVHDR
jgi:hypothetical protein